jgi:CRISPR-associated protein Cmr5
MKMRNEIEKLIPKAISAVTTVGIASDGKVAKQFNGYISSFGASLRQAGLVPTVLFFGSQNNRAEEPREQIVKAIEVMLGKELVHNGRANATRDEVDAAATALKLAIRTFKLTGD